MDREISPSTTSSTFPVHKVGASDLRDHCSLDDGLSERSRVNVVAETVRDSGVIEDIRHRRGVERHEHVDMLSGHARTDTPNKMRPTQCAVPCTAGTHSRHPHMDTCVLRLSYSPRATRPAGGSCRKAGRRRWRHCGTRHVRENLRINPKARSFQVMAYLGLTVPSCSSSLNPRSRHRSESLRSNDGTQASDEIRSP